MIDTMDGDELHATPASSEMDSMMATGFTQWSITTTKDSSKRLSPVGRESVSKARVWSGSIQSRISMSS